MDKSKELTQLDIDSSNAIKAGMSYGKYMAIKKSTKTTPQEVVGYKHICQHCGKEFVSKTRAVRKYCSDQCRERSYYPRKTYPQTKTCPICGKEFMAETYRNRYCSEFCSKVAHCQNVKEYQARKSEEERCNG